MNYDLVICQANGRPIMTEHLNAKFKEILSQMEDPDINAEDYVFHSLRYTSAVVKLKLSHGDFNSVMHAGGWANLEMLTRRYGAHSFEGSREKLANQMDAFLEAPCQKAIPEKADALPDKEAKQAVSTEQALKALSETDPNLLMEIIKSLQFANT